MGSNPIRPVAVESNQMLDKQVHEFTLNGASGTFQVPAQSTPQKLYAVRLEYTDISATADVTISDNSGTGGTVLTATDTNTDTTYYPRVSAQDDEGSDSTLTEAIPVVDGVEVGVAQGDDGGVLTVHLIFEA